MLQLLIEETTGEPFDSYMQTEVLQPLDMKNSTYDFRRVNKKLLSKAYDRAGNMVPNYLFPEKAAAGLYTTAADLAKFMAASFVGPNNEVPGRDVLSAATLELMFQSTKESNGTWGLGYQVGLNSLSTNEKIVLHSGSNSGWKVVFVEKPESGDGIVILTNSDNGVDLMLELVKKCGSN